MLVAQCVSRCLFEQDDLTVKNLLATLIARIILYATYAYTFFLFRNYKRAKHFLISLRTHSVFYLLVFNVESYVSKVLAVKREDKYL